MWYYLVNGYYFIGRILFLFTYVNILLVNFRFIIFSHTYPQKNQRDILKYIILGYRIFLASCIF